jgi:serine/threonine protein kinase
MSSKSVDENLSIQSVQFLCPNCKKRKNQGSMTWWIFASSHCQCSDAENSNSVSVDLDTSSGTQITSSSTIYKTSEKQSYELIEADQALDLGQRYEIIEKIGEGAFANVYKVLDKDLNLRLAAKVLRSELVADDTIRERFVREANLAITLTHENLVGMYGYNVSRSGQPFIVMDCLDGRSLAAILAEEGPLHKDRFISVFSQVLEGLSHAHLKGLIHRDLKPENIIVVEASPGVEVVKLLDFGIAKSTDSTLRTDPNLTQAGEVFGTPAFMSPEQCLGLEVDLRTDIYALGCVMHAALEGNAPFSGSNIVQIIAQHLNQEPPNMVLSTGSDYKGIGKIIQKCMAKEPSGRYQDTLELKRDLDLVARGKDPIDCHARWTPQIGWRRVGALAIDAGIVSLAWMFSGLATLSLVCLFVSQEASASVLGRWWSTDFLLMIVTFFPIAFLDSGFALLSPTLVALLFMVFCNSASAGHTMIGDLSHVQTFQQLFVFVMNKPLMRVILFLFEWVLVNWLYHAILESSARQATFGEALFHLRIARTNGKRISLLQATIRHFAKLLSGVLLIDLARIGINCCRQGFSSRAFLEVLSQPAHDKLSGCLVLDERESLLQQNRRENSFLTKTSLNANGRLAYIWHCFATMLISIHQDSD